MPRLVASLATRGRPTQLIQTLAQTMRCLSRPDTIMIVQVDSDDFATAAALSDAQLDPRVKVDIRKRPDSISEKWNRALSEPADVYLKSADDDPYQTPDLDEKILQAASFPDGIGMVYGHLANASFPGVIAYTAKWCEKFGWMEPEYFPYWFSDHWTMDIGKIIQRIAFADVRNTPSQHQTMGRLESAWWATWFDAAHLFRRAQAHKLIKDKDFDEPEWRKRLMLGHAPLFEFYSMWVNDTVRQSAKQLDEWNSPRLKDPRYIRIKQKAIDMMPHLLDDYGMEKQMANRFREFLTPSQTIQDLPRAYG